jgi:hypothetical protein
VAVSNQYLVYMDDGDTDRRCQEALAWVAARYAARAAIEFMATFIATFARKKIEWHDLHVVWHASKKMKKF